MSEVYLAESEESKLDSIMQGLKQFGSSKEIPTQKLFYKNNSPTPLFMTMLRKLILEQYQKSRYLQEDSLAKTSATLEKEQGLRGVVLHSGNIISKQLAKYDQDTHSLRTFQLSLVEGYLLYSATLPRSGMMQNGTVYQLPPLVRITKGIEYISFPTPTTADAWTDKLKSTQQKEGSRHSVNLSQAVIMFPTPTSRDQRGKGKNRYDSKNFPLAEEKGIGQLNPEWVEWLMGFPLGWTELNVSEMQSYRKLQKSLRKQSKINVKGEEVDK